MLYKCFVFTGKLVFSHFLMYTGFFPQDCSSRYIQPDCFLHRRDRRYRRYVRQAGYVFLGRVGVHSDTPDCAPASHLPGHLQEKPSQGLHQICQSLVCLLLRRVMVSLHSGIVF